MDREGDESALAMAGQGRCPGGHLMGLVGMDSPPVHRDRGVVDVEIVGMDRADSAVWGGMTCTWGCPFDTGGGILY